MRKLGLLFLLWVTLLASFVSITGLFAKVDLLARIFQILFLPVTVYLSFGLISLLLERTSVFDKNSGLRRLFIFYCFIVTTVLVTTSFFSARNLPQLISSLIFSPLAVYFLILVWPRANLALNLSKIEKSDAGDQDLKEPPRVNTKIDANRRDFLKLIGTAGVLAFVFNLFGKRATLPFLSGIGALGGASVQDSGGSAIGPSEKSPIEGYYIHEIDDSALIAYFGFVNRQGAWYIMRQDSDSAFRYAKGESDFSSNWANRQTLNYDYFDNVF